MKIKKENRKKVIFSAVILVAAAVLYILLKPASTIVQFFLGLSGGIAIVTLFIFVLDIQPPAKDNHKK